MNKKYLIWLPVVIFYNHFLHFYLVQFWCYWPDLSKQSSHRSGRSQYRNSSRALLTVGFLVSGSGSRSSKLLGLVPPRVGNQQGPVELDKDILDFLLALLVDVFLVVGDQGLGQRLSDGVHL